VDETQTTETTVDPIPAARGFRVPYGVDAAGSLVPPEQAARATPYVCPACADKLIYRAGPIVSAHFAHRGGTGCTPESVLHAGTKLRIAGAARAWLAGSGPRPIVRRRCHCGWVRDDPIRDGVATVSLEFRLRADERDVVADLALLNSQGKPRLLIEILVSHAFDVEKARALRAAKVPWIELDAERVQPEAVIWEPGASDNIRPIDCSDCAAREQARIIEIVVAADAIGISPKWTGYRTGIFTCYRCGRPTPIFLWPGMFPKAVPPTPRPRAIAWRYSSIIERKYWANTCGACHAMLGDHYIQSALDPSEYEAALPIDAF
jgi:hypothetical protein